MSEKKINERIRDAHDAFKTWNDVDGTHCRLGPVEWEEWCEWAAHQHCYQDGSPRDIYDGLKVEKNPLELKGIAIQRIVPSEERQFTDKLRQILDANPADSDEVVMAKAYQSGLEAGRRFREGLDAGRAAGANFDFSGMMTAAGIREALDPWKHRSKGMRCATCMWWVEKAGNVGRCRRHAPTMNGYPAVFGNDWCGDHKLDEGKA